MKKEIDDILAEMFPEYDIEADEETKEDFWDDLTEKQTYDVNAQHLRETQDPKYDYLVCWEPGRLDDDELVTDYDSMYDVDYKWWEFQKTAQWESIEETKGWMEKDPSRWTPEYVANSINSFNESFSEYSIYLSGDWYRLIDNNTFLYSQFISAKWYLYYQAEELLDDLQEENIPYTFRDEDFMKSINEKDPTKRYEASGREVELESYQNKIRDYQGDPLLNKIDFLITKYSRVFSGRTFRFDKGYEEGEDFDPFTDFIFFDEESLKRVSPKHFLKSFCDAQVSFEEFQVIIDELKVLVKEDFEKIYNENRSRYI